MRNSIVFLMTAVLLLATEKLEAQAGRLIRPMLRSGIAVALGVGRYSMRDEYFSAEKYSGTLPQFAATWSRLSESSGYSIGVEHRNSAELRNNNITAGVTLFSLDLDYLYRVATFRFLGGDARVFLGPSTGFFMYFSDLHIAFSELDIPYSFAILLPLGVSSTMLLPVSGRLQLSGSVRSSVFSLGLRMVDLVEDVDEESPVRFLTPPTGTNASIAVGIRYALMDRLSLDAGYELQLLRIRSWDPLLAASDNVSAGFTVGF